MGPRRKNTNLRTKGKIVETQSDTNANQKILSPRNLLKTPKATRKIDNKKPEYESESSDECQALSIKSSDSQSDSDTATKSSPRRARISDYKDSSSDSDETIEAQIAKLREKQALKRKQRDVRCRKRLAFDGGADNLTASTSQQDKPEDSNENQQLERRETNKEVNPINKGKEVKIKDVRENLKQPYYIEGRVIRKSCINTYNNANKSGSVITLLIADKESSIKVNAYDDAAEDVAKNARKMSCYKFKNIKVNEANIGWKICPHPYELVLDNFNQMENVEREDLADVTEEFNFSGFSNITKMPDRKQVYLIGTISHVYEKKTWGTNKKTSERRSVKIRDYDDEELSFTLWHKMCDLITPADVKKTIEIRGGHVTTYQGVKSITVTNAEIEIY